MAPATNTAGQISFTPRHPEYAAINQKGTINEKIGSWRPIIALKCAEVESRHALERDHRCTERTERNGRRVCNQ